MSLDKMLKEKDALRDLNSQFKCHINELNASLCALKTLTSCSHRVDSWKSNIESHPMTGWITTQVVFHKSNSLTPWTEASQSSLSITNCQSLLKLMSIMYRIPSNHLILCHPLLLLPSIFLSIRVFSNESTLLIRWPQYWSFSISPSNEYSGLISLMIDWLDLLEGLSKGPSRVFSNTTVQKHQFFSAQFSFYSNSHIHKWLLEKP